jgi:putative peptide maturation system protein
MNRPTVTLIDDALDLLVSLADRNADPGEAWAAVRDLQADHPTTGIELVWDEESFDRSFHFDLLLAVADDATVSLSYCRDRALPWPLRGVQRSSERALVRVDGEALTIDQAVALLDFVWDERRIANRLIDACLIRRELQRSPHEPSAEEIDRALAAFRRSRGLYTAEATLAWMTQHGLTVEQLRRIAAHGLAATRLRQQIAGGRVEQYFAEHRFDFDQLRYAEFIVAREPEAVELARQIAGGEIDFWDAARRVTAASGALDTPPTLRCVTVQRMTAPRSLSAAFGAAPGDVIGPVAAEGGYAVVTVIAHERAALTPGVRTAIEQQLFETWLAEQRAAARIEWFWGHAARTDLPL